MKEVKLIFPDSTAMAEFLAREKLNNAPIHSHEQAIFVSKLPESLSL
jgi:hypothetical protein